MQVIVVQEGGQKYGFSLPLSDLIIIILHNYWVPIKEIFLNDPVEDLNSKYGDAEEC